MKKEIKKKIRKNLQPLPEGVTVGGLVSYYLNGYRTGHLKEIKGNCVIIVPLGAYGHNNAGKHGTLVPISDIKKVE